MEGLFGGALGNSVIVSVWQAELIGCWLRHDNAVLFELSMTQPFEGAGIYREVCEALLEEVETRMASA
jgi:hypothetical protein